MVKREARILGIDDGPFDKWHKGKVVIVGVVYRGGNYPDGVISTHATIDGNDATEQLIKMINKSKFKKQLQSILLKGLAVGGFNVIDVRELSRRTGIPVLVVIRRFPNYKQIFKGLEKLKKKKAMKIIKELPEPKKFGKIWIQPINMTKQTAEELIKLTAIHADIPEPLRVAHIIASGMVKGESRGRA